MDGGRSLIQLCGPFVVRIEGRRVEDQLPSRQGQLLFAYLVVNRTRPVLRDELIEALWARGRPGAAESALSALLSKLRHAISPLELEGRSEIRLRVPEGMLIDLESAREAIHRAESEVAQERWREAWGPARVALHTANRSFLPGFEAPWIDELRHEVEGIQLRALECVAASGLGLGGPELAAVERTGRRLLALSPYNESGYRYLMEVLAQRGNVAEALRVYDELRVLLRDQLGIAPGEETQALHRSLLERRSG